MVYLRRIAIAALGCCLLGFQQEPEVTQPRETEANQSQETEQEGTEEAVSFVKTRLTASDPEEHDLFGCSVAISGNTAIIGALYGDDAGEDSGSAYLFDVMGNQRFKLTASDAAAGDHFGSVAISGNTAIVGAPGDDDEGENFGSAYLFDVTTGNQLFKLTDADENDKLGNCVAISGNTAIIGGFGSVYLFDVTTGNQLFKLTPSDAVENEAFGWSVVAISGNTAIVGASGSAYLFDVTTGNQLFKLTAPDAVRRNDDGTIRSGGFGYSVAISGNTAIVGASGRAYLFDVTTGNQISKLTGRVGRNEYFGQTVAISGNTAIVGAAWANHDGLYHAGAAYLFTR